MAESTLTTTSASGTQSQTNNPQTAGTSAGSGAPAASVQPGTARAVLDRGEGGVPLTPRELSTVQLSPTTATVSQSPPPAPTSNSPVAVGASILLFLVAAAFLIAVFYPVKNTTE